MKGSFKHLWRRSEDGNARPKRSFVRVVIIGAIALLLFMSLKKDNVFTLMQAEREIAVQKKEMQENERRIKEAREHMKALRTNIDSLEKFAREEFYFSAADEDVYLR